MGPKGSEGGSEGFEEKSNNLKNHQVFAGFGGSGGLPRGPKVGPKGSQGGSEGVRRWVRKSLEEVGALLGSLGIVLEEASKQAGRQSLPNAHGHRRGPKGSEGRSEGVRRQVRNSLKKGQNSFTPHRDSLGRVSEGGSESGSERVRRGPKVFVKSKILNLDTR